ncbi:hypothetical protein EVAR_31267_1 [Eumeta japonica]|uniref:Uncharacterized protein n=1 Tax=Eumeta variegata TaxID=151549 RepID=A0A4C1VRX4_EUMVA|nr:hypothetical protein EVAR_31267_1 [Eumeta japonica]
MSSYGDDRRQLHYCVAHDRVRHKSEVPADKYKLRHCTNAAEMKEASGSLSSCAVYHSRLIRSGKVSCVAPYACGLHSNAQRYRDDDGPPPAIRV